MSQIESNFLLIDEKMEDGNSQCAFARDNSEVADKSEETSVNFMFAVCCRRRGETS